MSRRRRWVYPLILLMLSVVLLTVMLVEYGRNILPTSRPTDGYAPTQLLPDNLPQKEVNPDQPQPELPDNPEDFAALQTDFPEAVGWITVPDTTISYAIMQSGPDTPEDFYLNHLEDGTKGNLGSIYIQRYNAADFTDPNTVIYGHNISRGRMFGAIHAFKDADYFEEHEYLYIYIPGHVLVYRIYSVFSYNERNANSGGVKHLLWAYDFDTEEGRQAFIDKTLNPKVRIKQVREGVTPTTEDRFVTLSTCIDGSTNGGRLLLVAMLEEDILTK